MEIDWKGLQTNQGHSLHVLCVTFFSVLPCIKFFYLALVQFEIQACKSNTNMALTDA